MTNTEYRESALHDPARWLAVLRIVIGAWFVKAMWSKWLLIGGILPVPVATDRWTESMTRIVTGYAEINTLPWVKAFLEQMVLPNARLFANLTAIGEVAVGLGLIFGLLSGLAAMIGLLITTAYTLGGIGLPLPQLGLRLITLPLMVAFLFGRAGRVWGVDAWIARRHPRSLLARFPLS